MYREEGQSLRLMSRPMFINVGKVQYPLGIDQEMHIPMYDREVQQKLLQGAYAPSV